MIVRLHAEQGVADERRETSAIMWTADSQIERASFAVQTSAPSPTLLAELGWRFSVDGGDLLQ